MPVGHWPLDSLATLTLILGFVPFLNFLPVTFTAEGPAFVTVKTDVETGEVTLTEPATSEAVTPRYVPTGSPAGSAAEAP